VHNDFSVTSEMKLEFQKKSSFFSSGTNSTLRVLQEMAR